MNVLKMILKHMLSLPIIKNGAARLIPMKSTPAYIQNPKAPSVAIAALTLPKSPNQGFDRTQSNIIQVTETVIVSIYLY